MRKSLYQTIYSLIDADDAPARLKEKEDPYRYFISIDSLGVGYKFAGNCFEELIAHIVGEDGNPLDGFEVCLKILKELESHPDAYEWVIDYKQFMLEFETVYDAIDYIAKNIHD